MTFTDEEKDALSFLHAHNALPHRMGHKRKTLETLSDRGYVDLIVMSGGRKWLATLTDEGKGVAEENKNYTKPVDEEKATSQVSMELLKRHPVYGLESVYERMDYSSYENFVQSAKSWISDRSELRDRTIGGADYHELYTHFCGLMGTEESK